MKHSIVVLVCLLLTSQICIFAADVIDPDLVLYFDFEEFSATKVVEKSGNGYDGRINGNVKQSNDGKFGNAAKFAAGSFLDLDGPNVDPDHIPTEGMSVVAWINVESIADMAIFNARAKDGTWLVHPEARGDGNYRWLNRGHNPDKTLFDIKAGVNKAKEWVHYAGTFSREEGMAYLYINGKKVGEEKARLPDPIAGDWGQGARVGYNINDNRPFTGLMDELNVWKRGLTEEEVNSIMNEGIIEFLSVEAQGKLTTTWGKLKTSK